MAGFVLPVSALLVPLVVRARGWDAATAGWTLGGQGLGVIAVSMLIMNRGALRRPGLSAIAGTVGAAVGTAVIAASPAVAGVVAGAVVTGLSLGLFMAHVAPLLLTATPTSYLARVQSLLVLVQSTCLLVSNLALGVWSDMHGALVATATCSLALAAVGFWGLMSSEFRAISFDKPATTAPTSSVASMTPSSSATQ
jgi:hypothetical protein